MRIVRFLRKNDEPRWGWIWEEKIGEIQGSPFGEYFRGEAVIPLGSVKLLAPVKPGKIVGIGRNYADHAREHDAAIPEVPLIFLKPATSVIGPGEKIILPQQSSRVEHEAELAVVIGRRARKVLPAEVPEVVLGYTIGNDVTARDLQRSDGQWTRGKGFDTFCPLGPWIDTEFDAMDAMITCKVNGELRQMGSTKDMIFHIRQLVTFVSAVMTLEPGDILLTGTPAGVGPIVDGDVVKIEIDGLGELVNPVQQES